MSGTGFAAPLRMPTQNAEAAIYGDDRSLMVNFTTEAIHQPALSLKEGRPIYKDVVYVHIVYPGGKSDFKGVAQMVEHDGIPPDPERFPRAWARFQNQQTEAVDGFPLEQWPAMPKAEILMFKAQGVQSVEQLGAIPDSALHQFGMNGRRYRDTAIAYLKNAKDGKEVSRLSAENSQLRADLEALKEQFRAFTAQEPEETPVPIPARRPGRPPKIAPIIGG